MMWEGLNNHNLKVFFTVTCNYIKQCIGNSMLAERNEFGKINLIKCTTIFHCSIKYYKYNNYI